MKAKTMASLTAVILSSLGLALHILTGGGVGQATAERAMKAPKPTAVRQVATPASTPVTPSPTVATPSPTVTPTRVTSSPTITAAGQTAAPTASLTPLVVTPVPTPENVFAAATRVAEATQQAAELGTPTPTPPNMVTATFTPRPFIVINSPTPANSATATYQSLLATAIAATTGTPTPLPTNAVTATPRPTPTPTPHATATPVFVLLEDREALATYIRPTRTPVPTATNVPGVLVGKIAFKSDRLGRTTILVMDPDGSNVALLTNSWPYEGAVAQEARSSNGSYSVYQANGGRGLDLFLHDRQYRTNAQLTRVGKGACWDMAWSPDNAHIAFTSNSEGDDEIFVVTTAGSVRQLTDNDWEWDKHPSYSPDGTRIVYWSNAGTGRRQIWVMNADGAEKHNISNSPYNDWDPVWIKGLW